MARSKWVARSVYVAVLALVLGAAWWTLSEDVEVPSAVVLPPAPPPPRSPPPPPPERSEDGAPVDAPPAVAQPQPMVAPSPIVPSTGPRLPNHPVDQEALAQESALITRARDEVKSDPETALKTIAEHQQKFPKGELAQDAELVRVEALLRLGRRPEAEALARKLTARDGALRKTVERLLAGIGPN